MKSLLDQILDLVEAGENPLIVWQPPPCEHPRTEGVASYRLGCRCIRCATAAHGSRLVVTRGDHLRHTYRSGSTAS